MKIEKAKAELRAAMSGPAGKQWSYGPAVSAVLAALAQAEQRITELESRIEPQEPIAWIVHARTGDRLTQDGDYVANAEGMCNIHSTPLYAAPPALGAVFYRSILGQIADHSVALRAGGPAPEDLQNLSEALETVTSLAYEAYTAAPSEEG